VLLLSGFSGVAAGLAAWALLRALNWATTYRVDHGWLIWLLPAAGLAIGAVYTYFAGTAARGTRHAVREARMIASGVPTRMAPLIFASATVGHLFGASVGREGASVQLSASLTDAGARALHLDRDDRQILLVAAVAAGFSAVVGTPVTGIFFGVQLTKRRSPLTLSACAIAAVVGDRLVRWLSDDDGSYPTLHQAGWSPALPLKLIAMGLLIGLVGRLYMRSGDRISHLVSRAVTWPPLRPVAGAVATIALAALVGRDYLGLSLPLLGDAVGGAHTDWWVPLLKLLFTVIAIGTGFVGGEVVPLFVIGATFGSVLSGVLHVPRAMLAACGLATLFTTAAQVGFTGVVLATELFGWQATIPAAIVAAAAWTTIGSEGLYVNRGESASPLAAVPSPSH
jgi:H+/Cl- antiporter ClcA